MGEGGIQAARRGVAGFRLRFLSRTAACGVEWKAPTDTAIYMCRPKEARTSCCSCLTGQAAEQRQTHTGLQPASRRRAGGELAVCLSATMWWRAEQAARAGPRWAMQHCPGTWRTGPQFAVAVVG